MTVSMRLIYFYIYLLKRIKLQCVSLCFFNERLWYFFFSEAFNDIDSIFSVTAHQGLLYTTRHLHSMFTEATCGYIFASVKTVVQFSFDEM